MRIDFDEQLSRNFKWGELLYSDTAQRFPDLRAKQENPNEDVQFNLNYLVAFCLQPLRDAVSVPINVTSGYRSKPLNRKIGGSKNSQHCLGEAVDLKIMERYLPPGSMWGGRELIDGEIMQLTGKPIPPQANSNYWLFCYAAMHMEDLDIDQLIHEYGAPGQPSWVHISVSRKQRRRNILIINSRGTARRISLNRALSLADKGTKK